MSDNSKGKSFDFGTTVQSLWNGRIDLFQTFWVYYFAIVFGLALVSNVLPFLSGAAGLLALVWAGFMVKPIWVAADAYKGPAHWALLAKAAAVLIGIAVVGNLLA